MTFPDVVITDKVLYPFIRVDVTSYAAALALTAEACAYHGESYWLGPDATANVGFVIDLGCYVRVGRVELRNSQNPIYLDRCDLIIPEVVRRGRENGL